MTFDINNAYKVMKAISKMYVLKKEHHIRPGSVRDDGQSEDSSLRHVSLINQYWTYHLKKMPILLPTSMRHH